MATRLKWITRFVAVAPGATVALPHGLNIDPPGGDAGPEPQVPDIVIPSRPGFTVTADATNVTVTNLLPDATSIDVLVEFWHTIERAFGNVALLELTPRPFVVNLSGAAADEASAVLGFGAGLLTELEVLPADGDYLWPWFDQDAATVAGGEGAGFAMELPVPRAGTIRNLHVMHNNPGAVETDVLYTLWVNGVASALTATLSADQSGPAVNLATDVVVAIGDQIALRASHGNLGEGSNDLEVVATMRFDQ